jgi:hypothetical protein
MHWLCPMTPMYLAHPTAFFSESVSSKCQQFPFLRLCAFDLDLWAVHCFSCTGYSHELLYWISSFSLKFLTTCGMLFLNAFSCYLLRAGFVSWNYWFIFHFWGPASRTNSYCCYLNYGCRCVSQNGFVRVTPPTEAEHCLSSIRS